MSNQRYPEEFKIDAAKQVAERGIPVAEVAARLGMSVHSLHAWVKRYSKPTEQRLQEDAQQAELRRLRAELKRVNEVRDILKNCLKDQVFFGHQDRCFLSADARSKTEGGR
jgi:transposase